MRRYKLTMLRINETRWTQTGQKRINTVEMLLYSGQENENAAYAQGVALMLFKEVRNAFIGWESHGSRILKPSFKTKRIESPFECGQDECEVKESLDNGSTKVPSTYWQTQPI
ncbi:unnamed protein product [Schistosoma mattheei]|uniref:Uncharacterized protein n=1 Tax=Schistosoma mattheei TaxID=31246 RepID=A0A183NUP9_9TREM|nr:unnamed protein product [Schistosoma mattheei]